MWSVGDKKLSSQIVNSWLSCCQVGFICRFGSSEADASFSNRRRQTSTLRMKLRSIVFLWGLRFVGVRVHISGVELRNIVMQRCAPESILRAHIEHWGSRATWKTTMKPSPRQRRCGTRHRSTGNYMVDSRSVPSKGLLRDACRRSALKARPDWRNLHLTNRVNEARQRRGRCYAASFMTTSVRQQARTSRVA